MDNLSFNDLQIFREKSRTFRGSVKISLKKICHKELPNNPRQFDEKNIATLLGFFRSEGCLHLDPEHHIQSAIVGNRVQPMGAQYSKAVESQKLGEWYRPLYSCSSHSQLSHFLTNNVMLRPTLTIHKVRTMFR